MRLFGREPALWLALLGAIVQGAGLLLNLSIEQQGVLNAVAAALVGLIAAAVVGDGLPAAILGFVKAFLAVLLAFGVGLSPEAQVAIMTLVAAVTAMFIRTQVTAPVPAGSSPLAASVGGDR